MKLPILLAVILAACGCEKPQKPNVEPKNVSYGAKDSVIAEVIPYEPKTYEKGVNDALMGNAMLMLQQMLEGTNRSNGDMARIVCKRLGVRYTFDDQRKAAE